MLDLGVVLQHASAQLASPHFLVVPPPICRDNVGLQNSLILCLGGKPLAQRAVKREILLHADVQRD